MSFITFIYRIGENPKTYYGKYCFEYISDDHEGLDIVVKYKLLQGLNMYKIKNNSKKIKSKIKVGILSFSSDRRISTESSKNEIKCFDFYYNYDNNIYVNGKLIENNL
jgi:hypothetical protein